ncbi:hypothetical protein J6590_025081 [Homalodisca vitripennis]|nr:hypothetical protein J6590_025081 [Homalodisca vitripennis]
MQRYCECHDRLILPPPRGDNQAEESVSCGKGQGAFKVKVTPSLGLRRWTLDLKGDRANSNHVCDHSTFHRPCAVSCLIRSSHRPVAHEDEQTKTKGIALSFFI